MSAAGEAEDAQASRAKPRRAARVCERGWCPTLHIGVPQACEEDARRARRRAIARGRHSDLRIARAGEEAA